MSKENKSEVFAIDKTQKEAALSQIAQGIQQLRWQHQFVVSQIESLPKPKNDDEKKSHAQRWVQADAIDKKIDDQIEFYQFCKKNI